MTFKFKTLYINSWPQIKKTETYDWSPFQDLSNGVLHRPIAWAYARVA